MLKIHLDFETRSVRDLVKEGVYRYASDPTTDVICASYAIGDGEIQRWRPGDAYPFQDLKEPFRILAWNAGFERLIWAYICANDYGWPDLDIEDFICVAATSRANALPGRLDYAAKALELEQKKDIDGHRLMLKMCRPKEIHDDGTLEWFETPDELGRLQHYCDNDVQTERAIHACLRPLGIRELKAYWDCEIINDAGLCFDDDFANAAIRYGLAEREYFAKRLSSLTTGEITTSRQFGRIKTWLNSRINDDVRGVMKHYVNGEPKEKFDAAVRHNLLSMDDETPGFLAPDVRELTELIHEAGKSSISKYQTLLNRGIDGTVSGLYMAFGAGQTGRYSSVGVQVHNLKRDVLADTARAIDEFKRSDPSIDDSWGRRIDKRAEENGGIVNMLALLLRPTFIADHGKWLVWSDWSAIEARALPWLANTYEANKKLAVFREADNDPQAEDIYTRNARAIGIKNSDGLPDRQIGKVAELSLGYGGGVGAFNAMARNYGVFVEEATAERIRDRWRDANPWAVSFWRYLWKAANAAYDRPGSITAAGRVSYLYTPDTHNGLGTLWCKLPSSRVIAYPGIKREPQETPWGETVEGLSAIKGNWHPKQGEKEWPRFKLWSGLLAENITQAACADLLMNAIAAALDAKIDVRGHTHDELLAQTDDPDRGMAALNAIMNRNPPWADGLPLKAEAGFGRRYKEK